jgi:hypothetical protein
MSLKSFFKPVTKSVSNTPKPLITNENSNSNKFSGQIGAVVSHDLHAVSSVSEEVDVPTAPEKKKAKRFFKWKDSLLVEYKWLLKDQNGKLFCKCCTKFPAISSKKFEFVKGWSGNEEGFKD